MPMLRCYLTRRGQKNGQIQKEVSELNEMEVVELEMQNERGVDFREDQFVDVIQIGDDMESLEDEFKQERMSRKGCMKATPLKIAGCLKRMIV